MSELTKQEIEKLKIELEGRNYSQRTVYDYSIHCGRFFDWLEKESKEITPESIKLHIFSLKKHYYLVIMKEIQKKKGCVMSLSLS